MIGNDRRRGALLMDVLDQRLRRRRVALVFLGNAGDVLCRPRSREVAPQEADARRDVRRPRRKFAVPEGHPCRRSRRRCHDHAIVLDGVDAPGRGAELKYIADARLVDEFLVQFAESRPVGQIHGIESAIGNGPTVYHRDEPGAAERR